MRLELLSRQPPPVFVHLRDIHELHGVAEMFLPILDAGLGVQDPFPNVEPLATVRALSGSLWRWNNDLMTVWAGRASAGKMLDRSPNRRRNDRTENLTAALAPNGPAIKMVRCLTLHAARWAPNDDGNCGESFLRTTAAAGPGSQDGDNSAAKGSKTAPGDQPRARSVVDAGGGDRQGIRDRAAV